MGNHGLRTVNISVASVVYSFNGGATALGRVLEEMGLDKGIVSSDFFVTKDCVHKERSKAGISSNPQG